MGNLCHLLLLLGFLGVVAANEVTFGTSYKFIQTVQLSDKESNPVNYQLRADAFIEHVHPNLLSVELNDLKLFTFSKKSKPGSYKERKSILDSEENNPFFIELDNGVVKSVYIADTERLPLLNVKKSFSNLFQFQTKSGERKEYDISGKCNVKYARKDSSIHKTKLDCDTDNVLMNDNIWSASIIPVRFTEIVLDGNKLKTVLSKEEFRVKANIADFADIFISTDVHLEVIGSGGSSKFENVNNDDILSFVSRSEQRLEKNYRKHNVNVDKNVKSKYKGNGPSLAEELKVFNKTLTAKHLGSKYSAVVGLKAIKAAKSESFDNIYNSLKSKKNKKIIPQLLDILGAVQTPESHKAAMKFLKLGTEDYILDYCERYLWALSTSAHYEKEIITDLLKLAESDMADKKLLETLIQTISSMVRKYADNTKENELLEETLKFLVKKFTNCSQEDSSCKKIYFKAFSNIGSPKVLDLLVESAVNGPKSIGARAMKTIWRLGQNSWNGDVLQAAERIYLSNNTYDSSAKTIALDILLETSESSYSISKIIQILKRKEVSSELKEYLLQRLAQVSEKNEDFKRNLKSVLVSEGLNHYNALATGGLSTAFERRFMKNGYLSTTQEVKSGILKEGFVHVNLENNGVPQTVFTLGIFSNGLGSFVSDDSGDNDDESTNAGLELTVLGVELRPFVFFEGHGELMGHVFSGAGSTLTPAYQAILLMEDNTMVLPLVTGDLLKVRISSVASVDLSGKIEISLWSRTADSVVQNSAGLIVEETIEILSPYINTQLTSQLSAEPQLKLSSNIEFSNKIALCLSLEQPEVTVQFDTTATTDVLERSFRKSYKKRRNIIVPGRTYALNSKNNEMCRVLHQQTS